MDDDDLIERDFSALEHVRPDVYALLVDDPTQGFPPTEDLVETGLFSQAEDGLLYLPEGAQAWVVDNRLGLAAQLDADYPADGGDPDADADAETGTGEPT
jgi:hypothetical protein